MFQRQGQITIPAANLTEDKVFEAAIEAGADDVQREDENFVVYTRFEDMHPVNEALGKAGITVSEVKAVYSPTMTTMIKGDHAKGLLKLMDALEDNDDVQNVWANFDMDDSDMEAFEG